MGKSYPDSRVVETAYGKVCGRRISCEGDKQVDAFHGIPFAKPPLKELRFKKPVPPDPWEGIRETKKWPKRCTQKNVLLFDTLRYGRSSEDCLYLNVFTPCWQPPPQGFAVLVFMHGGAFIMDSSKKYGDIGICRSLCTKNLVVVTIQYRLGYLGFLYTGDDRCDANIGLWDQTEALKWVQENIGAFGGNKDNVTLAGQSAGGVSVDLLQLSEHSNGLFHKVIPMAGNACSSWTFSDMKSHSELLARKLRCDPHDPMLMEKYRKLPAERFAVQMVRSESERDDLECSPVIDGDFLVGTIDEMRGKTKPKPMMTGVCTSEALLFMIATRVGVKKFKNVVRRLNSSNSASAMKQLDEIISSYIDLSGKSTAMQRYRAYSKLLSDIMLTSSTLKLAQDTVDMHPNTPVYLYEFEHCNRRSYGWLGLFMPIKEATHCTELAYLFGKGILFSFPFTRKDKAMNEMFTTAVANFAKFGDPNGINASSDLPVHWNTSPCMKPAFFEGRPARILSLLRKGTD